MDIEHKSDSDPIIETPDDEPTPFIEIDTQRRSGKLNISRDQQIVLVYCLGIGLIIACVAGLIGMLAYLAWVIGFRLQHLGLIVWLLPYFLALWWFPPPH